MVSTYYLFNIKKVIQMLCTQYPVAHVSHDEQDNTNEQGWHVDRKDSSPEAGIGVVSTLSSPIASR